MMDFTGLYLLFGCFLLIGLGFVALYVLRALGLYRLAKNAGIPAPWLAWVPVVNWYLLGLLCDRACCWHTGGRWNFALWLPVVNTLGSPWFYVALVELLPYSTSTQVSGWMVASGLQGLLGLGATALTAAALYYFYRDYAPEREGLYTVLSVVLAFAAPHVLLFLLRGRLPCSVTGVRPSSPQPGGSCYTTGPWQPSGAARHGGGSGPAQPPAPSGGGQRNGAAERPAGPPARGNPPPASPPDWLPRTPAAGNSWQPGGEDGDFYQGGGPERR